jgi:primosomal protein N' (replication factor Y) (superfamily II helicase)
LARLLVRGKKEEDVVSAIKKLKSSLDEIIKNSKSSVMILGPVSAPLARISNNFRYHMLLKSGNIESIRQVIRTAKINLSVRGVYLEIDIDPYDIL